MRIVLVTGIFPPEIGGPATHAADLVEELSARGHRVTVLTLSDDQHTRSEPGLIRYPRAWPWPFRLSMVAWWLVRSRRDYDVVYATGMHSAAVAGARAAGRPVVLKVVGDPAWERGSRLGLTAEGFDEFRPARGADPRLRAMGMLRDWSLRRATALTVPSPYLAGAVERWLGEPGNPEIVPNGVRLPPGLPRRRATGKILRCIWVGRLVGLKQVDRIIEALSIVDGVSLEVVGDGPEGRRLEQLAESLGLGRRVKFAGRLGRDETLRRLAAADVLILASSHEGLPHAVLEALACGTPVVVPDVGGTADVVVNERNGLLLSSASAASIVGALRRLRDDPELRRRLSRQARDDAKAWRFERTADGIERLLLGVLPPPGWSPAAEGTSSVGPRRGRLRGRRAALGAVRKIYLPHGPGGGSHQLWDHAWHEVDLDHELARMRAGRDPLVRRLARWIPAGATLLEAGSGSGRVLAFLSELGARSVGVDFAAGALAEASRRHPGLRLVAGDVSRLPFRDASFDRVVSLGVVEHFEEGPGSALREHARVLKPGGILLVATPRLSPLKRFMDWRELGHGRRSFYRSWRGMAVIRVPAPGREAGGDGHGGRPGTFYQYEFPRGALERDLRAAGLEMLDASATAVSLGLREIPAVRAAFQRLTADGQSGGTHHGGSSPEGPGPAEGAREWAGWRGRLRDLVVAERARGPVGRTVVRALQDLSGHMHLLAARRR
jgi:glycosyltransferase involved in cell wall biosynthesis/SAM-dependent methyltransferase